MNKRNAVTVVCPACRKRGDWLAGQHGPFCSQRCRLVDLGKWFGGEHVISEPLRAEHLAAATEEPGGSPADN